jgi:hypothetical protein
VFLLAQKRKGSETKPPADTVAVVKVDTAKLAADSAKLAAEAAALAALREDSIKKVKADSLAALAKKDCYQAWYEVMRARGAKPVTDGMQQIVIALKDTVNCNCFMGQVEVAGGKIKPPLYVQQENGEYRPITVMGKKIEPAFAAAMGEDQLHSISEGMSIVFRTTDNEYGRIFFYKFVNKSAQSNKTAPSPTDLIKD